MPDLVAGAVPAGRLGGRVQPTLRVDELCLRPWLDSDVDAVVEAYRDPDIQRWHVRTMARDEALSWLRSWSERWRAETGASWAITRRDVPAGREVPVGPEVLADSEWLRGREVPVGPEVLVGRVGLRTVNLAEGFAEVGYWTMPPARGQQIAGRAVRAMSDWLFGVVGLHRLELNHSTRNPASCRVAEKAGFDYEGTRRQQGWHADGWHDMHLHARLAPADRP